MARILSNRGEGDRSTSSRYVERDTHAHRKGPPEDRGSWPPCWIGSAGSPTPATQADHHNPRNSRTTLSLCTHCGEGFAAYGEARHGSRNHRQTAASALHVSPLPGNSEPRHRTAKESYWRWLNTTELKLGVA